MVLAVFVVLVAALFLGKKIFGSLVNPFNLFIGVFGAAFILLFASDFMNLRLISFEAWGLYILSFVLFGLGSVVGRYATTGAPSELEEHKRYVSEDQKERYWHEILLLFVIMMIGVSAYYISAIVKFGFSGLLTSLMVTQENETLEGVSIIASYLKFISLFLSPYVTNYLVEYKEKKVFCSIIIVITVLANLSYTRNVIVYILVLDALVCLYSKYRKKLMPTSILKYAALGLAFVIFFTYTQALLNKTFEVRGTLFGIAVSSSIITMVSYFAGPLVSTAVYFSHNMDVPFLGYSLRTARSLLNNIGFDLETSRYMPTEFIEIPFRFNTTTMQFYIMEEGGLIWFSLFFLIAGVVCARAYVAYHNSKSRYSMMALVLVSLIMVFSIRNYMMVRLDVFVYIMLLLAIYLLRNTKFVFGGKR